MTEVKLRSKQQITIPAAIVRAANLRVGSVLEVRYSNGVITMTPCNESHPLQAKPSTKKAN